VQPTKLWSLAVIAGACGVLAWIAVKVGFASLPPLPWTLAGALVLLAIGEVIVGRNLGPRLDGRPGAKPIQPLAVPRIAALAKASSAAAACFGGLAIGVAIYTLPSLGKPTPRHDAIVSTVTAIAAICLAAAALYLERCCRAAPPEDDDDDLPSSNGQRGRR